MFFHADFSMTEQQVAYRKRYYTECFYEL